MREILLTRGHIALVDDEDFSSLSLWKWSASSHKNVVYAVRNLYSGHTVTIKMHRIVMGLTAGDPRYVDHIDGNGLNNRRANLRICTGKQNQGNRRPNRNGSSQYKGVYWSKNRGKWNSQIGKNGKSQYIGCLKNEEEAARAYDEAAFEYFGGFARLNFPLGKEVTEKSELEMDEVLRRIETKTR